MDSKPSVYVVELKDGPVIVTLKQPVGALDGYDSLRGMVEEALKTYPEAILEAAREEAAPAPVTRGN